MTTRSRIAFLLACSTAALGFTTASALAANPPASQSTMQSAPQHAGKNMVAHHAKARASHARNTTMHHTPAQARQTQTH